MHQWSGYEYFKDRSFWSLKPQRVDGSLRQRESRGKANRNDERLQVSICLPEFVLGDSDRKRLFDGAIVTGVWSSVRLP